MNEWISVKDRLPDMDCLPMNFIVAAKVGDEIVIDFAERYPYHNILTGEKGAEWEIFHDWDEGQGCEITHWMPLPKPPTEQNKLTLVDNNKMLWVGKEHFRCSCGGNVFSEYKDNDGKRVFECHSCRSKYEGE